MAGMKIVPIGTDAKGNVDIKELESAAIKHKDKLAALMITYPSTHGVYEDNVDEICRIVHDNGGQVCSLSLSLSISLYIHMYTLKSRSKISTSISLD